MNDERDHGIGHPSATHQDSASTESIVSASLRGDKISVGSGDENVAKIQLAARWAEEYAPNNGDTLDDALRRFKRAYLYLDSVTKLVDPDDD